MTTFAPGIYQVNQQDEIVNAEIAFSFMHLLFHMYQNHTV